jgi:putative protease
MLEAGVDSFKIDGILKDLDYLIAVTKAYRNAVDLYSEDPDLYDEQKGELLAQVEKIQPENRSFDTGFFFKETVY